MTPARIRLKRNLDFYLKQKNINCMQLSKMSNVSFSVVYKYKRAEEIEPNLDCLRRLAKALEINVGDLMKEVY